MRPAASHSGRVVRMTTAVCGNIALGNARGVKITEQQRSLFVFSLLIMKNFHSNFESQRL